MDTEKLISFLGHSSIHQPLDAYLISIGVKKRLKKIEASEQIIEDQLGIALDFRASDFFDLESLVPKKSEGEFILQSVTFMRTVSSPLPFGLSLDLSKQAAEAILGKPLKEKTSLPSATWLTHGLIVIINWKKSDPANGFIRFRIPDIDDKEQLGVGDI